MMVYGEDCGDSEISVATYHCMSKEVLGSGPPKGSNFEKIKSWTRRMGRSASLDLVCHSPYPEEPPLD